MSLSRQWLASVMVAIGLLFLFGCPKAENTATETSTTTTTTTTSATDTAATATTGTTVTSTTGTTSTDTATTAKHIPPGGHYGRTKEKLGGKEWGTKDTENVTVKFVVDAQTQKLQAVGTPEPAQIKARKDKDHPTAEMKVTWTADPGVKLHVKVVAPDGLPSCIKDEPKCKDNICSATTNPDQYTPPPKAGDKEWYSTVCKVKIWKEGMSEPADPDIIVDNCCP